MSSHAQILNWPQIYPFIWNFARALLQFALIFNLCSLYMAQIVQKCKEQLKGIFEIHCTSLSTHTQNGAFLGFS